MTRLWESLKLTAAICGFILALKLVIIGTFFLAIMLLGPTGVMVASVLTVVYVIFAFSWLVSR